MSPRETLLKACEDALKRITLAGGYLTNAGNYVTREPAPKLAEEKSPLLAVVWDRQDRAPDAFARVKRATTVKLFAKVPAAYDQAQAVLDNIVSDIETALTPEQNFRFPPGYEFPQYQSTEPLAADVAAGWIGVVLTYTSLIPIK